MTYRQKQKVSPGLIKAMFGDSLKAGYWLDQKPGATVVPDFSGNGHDGTPSGVEFGQRSLAPGMVGRSAGFDGGSSEVILPSSTPQPSEGIYRVIFAVMNEGADPSEHAYVSNRKGSTRPSFVIHRHGGELRVALMHPDGDEGYQFGPLPIGASLLVDVEIDVDAGVVRTAINGEAAGETSTTAGRDYSVDDDL